MEKVDWDLAHDCLDPVQKSEISLTLLWLVAPQTLRPINISTDPTTACLVQHDQCIENPHTLGRRHVSEPLPDLDKRTPDPLTITLGDEQEGFAGLELRCVPIANARP